MIHYLGTLICTLVIITRCHSSYFADIGNRESKRQSQEVHINRKLFFKNVIPPPETIASLDENIILECEAGGSPPPVIHWLHNGRRIIQGSSHDIEDDEAAYEASSMAHLTLVQIGSSKSKLFLDCISEKDVGMYTCVADTPFQRLTTDTKLTLEPSLPGENNDMCLIKRSLRKPSRIYFWTATRLELEGADVQLFCRAEGTSSVPTTWLDQRKREIHNGGKYTLLPNGDLLISAISWIENMGTYTCMAGDKPGSQSRTTFLYPTPRRH